MTTTLTPTDVRDLALQSVKDHIEDVYCQLLPVDPAQTNAERIRDVMSAHWRLGRALERLEDAQDRVDRCRCQPDQSQQVAADAAAAVLAAPGVRERLGRAPLASDWTLP